MSDEKHNLYTRALLRNSFHAPPPFRHVPSLRGISPGHARIRRVALLAPEAVALTIVWKK